MKVGAPAIDWGGYGVPETFIIDGDGIIRFKWVGPAVARNAQQDF